MKLCEHCGQLLAEDIRTCPSCGSEVAEGRRSIDDYRILAVLHEGYASILCKAVRRGSDTPVMIRIFTPQSGINEEIAGRLQRELEETRKLPEDYFVRHVEICKSAEGLWYRVSEWIEAENWSDLLASGTFRDYRVAFALFARIASILEGLHRTGHFIPHLILHDIIVFKGPDGALKVKIDYKLSRFLDPQMDRPGPMLQKLLRCHPDIVNGRPLDYRSDIWSLGKIFVELLSADLDSDDVDARIPALALPPEIDVLFKIMLADEPDLRPRSMEQVAQTLLGLKEREVAAATRRRRNYASLAAQEIRGLKRWIRLTAAGVLVLAAAAGGLWWLLAPDRRDDEAALADYANRYAPAVAFVVVDYRLADEETVYYRNRTEGTAFLADTGGYLLTNRHVACPWLVDGRMAAVYSNLRQHLQKAVNLTYDAYLWFDGQKAFKRLPVNAEEDPADRYVLESAYRTTPDAERRLTIAGVARAPEKTFQKIKSPLQDDFAVLRVEPPPAGIRPLPLDRTLDPMKIPKLLPVIALGFPLGSQTQEAAVNVSVTTGHVRRTFENLLQVDTSLYRGNSGGPIIDISGRVIGIASSVAVDWAAAPLPVATPLSDMGMVFPITRAATFLEEVKAGRPKWNGLLDLTVEAKVRRILDLAGDGRWQDARNLADNELKTSADPALTLIAGLMHYCTGSHLTAASLFDRVLSMDATIGIARMMQYLIDWQRDLAPANLHRRQLLAADWRDPDEFYGYLVRVLEGGVDPALALAGGYSDTEQSWLQFAVGLKAAVREDAAEAVIRLRQAASTGCPDPWPVYLALARLADVHATVSGGPAADAASVGAFAEAARAQMAVCRQQRARISALEIDAAQAAGDAENRRGLVEEMARLDSGNSDYGVWLMYLDAAAGSWEGALAQARSVGRRPGRENRSRLRVGLMEGQLLKLLGRSLDADACLRAYADRTADDWYAAIARSLLGDLPVERLVEKAAEAPEYLLTAHTALGLWAEGRKDSPAAVAHYREALASYLDETPEYDLALQRFKALRR